ncbi:MAG TPA: DUF4145 domain-containing protein [Planctomycetota bacterium]|nr:DUF4145 domain-containing protein [Planctomycetota bacterium]
MGLLVPTEDKLMEAEDIESKAASSHEDWEPTWYTGAFAGFIQCNNPDCRQSVAVLGTVSNDDRDDDEGGREIFSVYAPKIFIPPLHLFNIVSTWPIEIRNALIAAFQQVFIDPGSAVNHLRTVIEELLTSLGYARYEIKKGAPRKFISLHSRIDRFAKDQPQHKDTLLAAKWIGNAGSHPGSITKDDAFDAFDLIEFALNEILGKQSKSIATLAKKVNKSRKPLSTKKNKSK